MAAEEAEHPSVLFQLAFQFLQQRMRLVHGDQRSGEEHFPIGFHNTADGKPVLPGQLMAESSLQLVRLLVVLELQRVCHGSCGFDGAGHGRFRVQSQGYGGFVVQQIAVLSGLIGFAFLHIRHVHQQGNRVPQLFTDAGHSFFAAYGSDFFQGGLRIRVGNEAQFRLGPLLGVGIEPHTVPLRSPVSGNQTLAFQPLPEILAHQGFQLRASQG